MIHFCTLFDSNYLDKGLALYRSLETVSNDYTLYIFCFDDVSHDVLSKMKLPHVILIHHSDIETPQLLKLKAERSKAEYCWTCTPVIIEYVLDHYEVDSCTYIDADLYFFHDPEILFREIRESGAGIVITEHRFSDSRFGKKWLAKSGRYCVEFNYFDQSEEARKALAWWKEKCLEWCYAIYEPDRMGDQKYLEQFPVRFKKVHELQHLGGGVAPWNLNQYELVDGQEDVVLREKKTGKVFQLVFYHFQNIRYLSNKKVNVNSGTWDKKLKKTIYFPYLREIEECRRMTEKEYGLGYAVKKSYSSNKIKAFIQRNIMQFVIRKWSDVIRLDKL